MRSLRSVLLSATLVVLLAGVLAACGDDDGGGGDEGGAVGIPADVELADETGLDTLDVAVPDNTFDPAWVTIDAGTKVVWTNQGRNDHNVVPVNEGSFEGVDTADFGPGQVHTFTFDDPGDYPYYCSIHGTKKLNGQAGGIRVVEAG